MEKSLHWELISRALSNHDPMTVYTLLAEVMPNRMAGAALLELIKTVPDWPKTVPRNFEKQLTGRELEVLQAASDGLSILDLVKKIVVSVETVKTHRRHIREKLQVETMPEACYVGRQRGLIN